MAEGTGERLGAFLERWVRDVPVRESTRAQYQSYIARHIVPAIGRVPLVKLTAEQVNALLQSTLRTGLSPRSVAHIRSILRNGLNRAVRWGLVTRNVAALADAPRVPEYEPRFLTIAEARRFLEIASADRLSALYSVALSLGLREGEALALRWEDIDLDGRRVHVNHNLSRVRGKGLQLLEPKTKRSRRTLVMPEAVALALRSHRARQIEERLASGPDWRDLDFVFTTYKGTPLSAPNVIARSFRGIARAAGIERLRFHDLRHSAATLLLAQLVPQRVVMEVLGHSTLSMTARYEHVLPSLMGDAAAAMGQALGS